jgi:pimeloyl-ACP methyl ester carboxylesterase
VPRAALSGPVVSGSLDMCQGPDRGRRLADLSGGQFVLLEGSGHLPNARDPVKINLLLHDFVQRATRATA